MFKLSGLYSTDLILRTFPEDYVSHVAEGADGALLHGVEGALARDLLHLSLRQVEAEEAGDVTDALAQVL